jgi:hypothetical protein
MSDPVVSWEALARVTGAMHKGRYVPEFPPEVVALESKTVRVEGYMTPVEAAVTRTRRFLLMPEPSDGDCLPVGLEQIVEVEATRPLRYVLDPVAITGRFAVVRDGTRGFLYRLTDAVQIEERVPAAGPGAAHRHQHPH